MWKTRPVAGFDYTKHLSIIVPVVAAVGLMVEVYGVSDFSVTTSLAILSAAGPGQVAVGAIFTLVPYLLPIIALVAIAWGVGLRRTGGSADRALLALALAISALLLSAWQNLVVVGVAAVLYVAVFAAVARLVPDRAGGPRSWRPRPGPMVLVALLAATFASLKEPWTAPEVITVRATPEVVDALEDRDGFVRAGAVLRGVAYPLETTEDEAETYLVRTTRRVLRLPDEAVVARTVCRFDLPSHHAVLLDQLLGNDDPTANPACPDAAALAR